MGLKDIYRYKINAAAHSVTLHRSRVSRPAGIVQTYSLPACTEIHEYMYRTTWFLSCPLYSSSLCNFKTLESVTTL